MEPMTNEQADAAGVKYGMGGKLYLETRKRIESKVDEMWNRAFEFLDGTFGYEFSGDMAQKCAEKLREDLWKQYEIV